MYGIGQQFDNLEFWGNRIAEIASEFPYDQEIRGRQASGYYNGYVQYSKTENKPERAKWRKLLADTALDCPNNPEVQYYTGLAWQNYAQIK